MMDYGMTERWHARQCARKWHELFAEDVQQPSYHGQEATMPFPSPSEAFTQHPVIHMQ